MEPSVTYIDVYTDNQDEHSGLINKIVNSHNSETKYSKMSLVNVSSNVKHINISSASDYIKIEITNNGYKLSIVKDGVNNPLQIYSCVGIFELAECISNIYKKITSNFFIV